VLAAIERLRGEYLQTPPAYSAKKVAGRRAYDFARSEEAVVLTPVPVCVSRAELTDFSGERAMVTMTSSPGFYVRSFAHELGRLVGTGACLEALRRTRSGEFRLAEALPMEALLDGVADVDVIPVERLLASFPSVVVTDEGLARVTHGRQLESEHYSFRLKPEATAEVGSGRSHVASGVSRKESVSEWTRLFDSGGRLTALGTAGSTRGSLHPAIVLI
jgi:tRNA pseudouridine55 synthase